MTDILHVCLDDCRDDTIDYGYEIMHLPKRRRFTRALDEISLCDPARGALLTGLWSYRAENTVVENSLVDMPLGDETKTYVVSLDDAGYAVGWFGKRFIAENEATPPGVNSTCRILNNGINAQNPYNYEIWNGSSVITPGTYQTDYLTAECATWVATAAQPFYAYLSFTAPHLESNPAPRHYGRYEWVDWDVRTGENITGKPAWIAALSAPTAAQVRVAKTAQRRKIRELQAVDEGIRTVIDACPDPDDLVVIVHADNGGMLYEHRLPGPSNAGDKNYLYDESLHFPLICSGPGFTYGDSPELVTMQDVTATLIDITGATPEVTLDGVSLLDVQNTPGDYTNRTLYHRAITTGLTPTRPSNEGLSTATRRYIKYPTESDPNKHELYDRENDPDELVNRAYDGGSWLTERNAFETLVDAFYP